MEYKDKIAKVLAGKEDQKFIESVTDFIGKHIKSDKSIKDHVCMVEIIKSCDLKGNEENMHLYHNEKILRYVRFAYLYDSSSSTTYISIAAISPGSWLQIAFMPQDGTQISPALSDQQYIVNIYGQQTKEELCKALRHMADSIEKINSPDNAAKLIGEYNDCCTMLMYPI